jgi:hypothetical protein
MTQFRYGIGTVQKNNTRFAWAGKCLCLENMRTVRRLVSPDYREGGPMAYGSPVHDQSRVTTLRTWLVKVKIQRLGMHRVI